MNSSLTVAETVDRLVHEQLLMSRDCQESCLHPFDLIKARLYIVPLADDAPVLNQVPATDDPIESGDSLMDKVVLLDEDENPYRLLRRTRHHPPVLAGCLVATGWCAPFALDDDASALAPSCHPRRQRVRLTVAITRSGISSVLRQSREPDVVHSLPSRGMGDLPDVLDAWWNGS